MLLVCHWSQHGQKLTKMFNAYTIIQRSDLNIVTLVLTLTILSVLLFTKQLNLLANLFYDVFYSIWIMLNEFMLLLMLILYATVTTWFKEAYETNVKVSLVLLGIGILKTCLNQTKGSMFSVFLAKDLSSQFRFKVQGCGQKTKLASKNEWNELFLGAKVYNWFWASVTIARDVLF